MLRCAAVKRAKDGTEWGLARLNPLLFRVVCEADLNLTLALGLSSLLFKPRCRGRGTHKYDPMNWE
jgi:hypothetical protein